jgi:hypothetical protein
MPNNNKQTIIDRVGLERIVERQGLAPTLRMLHEIALGEADRLHANEIAINAKERARYCERVADVVGSLYAQASVVA